MVARGRQAAERRGWDGGEEKEGGVRSVEKRRRKDGTMIGTVKISGKELELGLNELNDEKVLKRNILARDLI